MNPAWPRPWRNAAMRCAESLADVIRKMPTTGMAGGARARGHAPSAAAPANNAVVKSRRLMIAPPIRMLAHGRDIRSVVNHMAARVQASPSKLVMPGHDGCSFDHLVGPQQQRRGNDK